MDKLTKITAPAGDKLRQIQKIVSEIKNNESGLMQKLKRITNKPPPSVPKRDYVTGPQDDENDEWKDEFGSDYESPDENSDHEESYVVPSEEEDESYEPPPNEPEPRFTPSYKFTDRNGGYAEKDRNRQLPSTPNDHTNRPTRPLPNPKETLAKPATTSHQINHRLPFPSKPVPKPMPKPAVAARQQPTSLLPSVTKTPINRLEQQLNDEDYVVPQEDYNYIDPTASPEPSKPPVNRASKPGQSSVTKSPDHEPERDLYEVPENEEKPSTSTRVALPLPRRISPPKREPQERFDDADRRPAPCPLPRNGKSKPLPLNSKTPGLLPRDVNSNIGRDKPPVIDRSRIQSAGSELPPLPPSRQKPPEVSNRYVVNHSRRGSAVEQDAGVVNKEWYSSSCDRKAAEEALLASSKDGSFLVRKSTGHDLKQPFTLVVFYKRRVYNIPVRYIESTQQYALGREKSGEEKFSSVAEMIKHHQRTNLVLIDSHTNTKDSTKLSNPISVP